PFSFPPMLPAKPAPDAGPETRRYDAPMLQKVAALAALLQSQHQESLTEAEVEAIGGEIGLQPEFLRQALAQLDPPAIAPSPAAPPPAAPAARVAAFGLPAAWALSLYLL